MLLEGVALDEARVTAERLRRSVDEHRFFVGDRAFDLGVSVGVVPVDGSADAAALMALADTALYTAKEKGRNRVTVIEGTAGGPSLLSEASRWASRIKAVAPGEPVRAPLPADRPLRDGPHRRTSRPSSACGRVRTTSSRPTSSCPRRRGSA